MEYAVKAANLTHSYISADSSILSLENIDISVRKGEFAAIIGRNGSGKSTLAKHFNALVPIMHGTLFVGGMNVADKNLLWQIRKYCAMVFQNPDNQFVSSIIKEDIAFGLNNYSITDNVDYRISSALEQAGLKGFENRSVHMLSGGQKQRAAIAGILALEPEIIVFDEATSMLDPKGRRGILSLVSELNKKGKTVIMITHYAEEAVLAEKVYVLSEGKLIGGGSPREVLTDMDLLNQAGLVAPLAVSFYYDLIKMGIRLKKCPLTLEELSEEICSLN